MDISRLRELGGVEADKKSATTVTEVLIENQSTEVSALTNRLRSMAGLDPITESIHLFEKASRPSCDKCDKQSAGKCRKCKTIVCTECKCKCGRQYEHEYT